MTKHRSAAPAKVNQGALQDAAPASMEAATKSGVAWASGSRLLVQVVQFASTVALARLLTPGEYGLVVIVTAFTTFALFFTDLGLGSAVIHADDPDEELLSTAFWLNMITGVVLTALFCALAVPIAHLYGHPQLAQLIVIGSFAFTLAASTVNLALLERAMRFRKIAFAELAAAIIGFGLSVLLAALGLGAQSIIWGALAQTASTTVFMWRASGWLPSRFVSRKALKDLWAFSSHLFGFNIVNYWARNLDDLLLGKYASASSLALYSRAYGLMLLPVQQVTVAAGRVLFPSFARLRHDPERLKAAYLRSLQMLVGLVAPLSFGLSAAAVAFIDVAYGPKWGGAAPFLAILAASGPAQVVSGSGGAIYRALGSTKSLLRRSLLSTALTIGAIIFGLHWGAFGVATALLCKFYVLTPVGLNGAWKQLDITTWKLLVAFRPILLASALMAAGMLGCGWLLRDQIKLIVLLGQCFAGLAIYVLAIKLLARDFADEVLTLFVPARRKNPASSSPVEHA